MSYKKPTDEELRMALWMDYSARGDSWSSNILASAYYCLEAEISLLTGRLIIEREKSAQLQSELKKVKTDLEKAEAWRDYYKRELFKFASEAGRLKVELTHSREAFEFEKHRRLILQSELQKECEKYSPQIKLEVSGGDLFDSRIECARLNLQLLQERKNVKDAERRGMLNAAQMVRECEINCTVELESHSALPRLDFSGQLEALASKIESAANKA